MDFVLVLIHFGRYPRGNVFGFFLFISVLVIGMIEMKVGRLLYPNDDPGAMHF